MRRVVWSLTVFLLAGSAFATQADNEAAEDEVVKVDEIVTAMQFNHAAADEHFIDKPLQVRGKVHGIQRIHAEEDAPAEYLLTLQPEANGASQQSVLCRFAASQRRGLAEIKRGAAVILSGTCRANKEEGQGLLLRFEDCKLLRIFETPPEVNRATSGYAPSAPTAPSPFPSAPPRAVP